MNEASGRWRWSVVVAVGCSAMVPGAALSLPGDPPPVPLTPVEGATLVSDPAGTPVTFECPPYQYTSGQIRTDYAVSYSRTPRLRGKGVLDHGPYLAMHTSPGRCSFVISPDASGIGQAGVHYWMVSREVANGSIIETGPVRRFTLRLAGSGSLALPATAYAGYLFKAQIGFQGLPFGTRFALQRRSGRRWVTVARGTVFDRGSTSETFAKLPAGRQRLRTVAGPVVTLARPIDVLPATDWSTLRSAGDYAGAGRGQGRMRLRSLRFRIPLGGRLLRAVDISADVPCPTGPGAPNPPTVPARIRRALVRIAPDGRFVSIGAQHGQPFLDIRGRVVGNRVTGRIFTGFAECGGVANFVARRQQP